MAFLSIRSSEQSVIAVAVPMRSAWPASEPSPKKLLSLNMPMVASLPVFRDDCESYFSRLKIKNRVCRVPLRENGLLLRGEHSFLGPRR
jgi:hypothetical protein